MSEMHSYSWQKVEGTGNEKLDLQELKEATVESFKNESDNAKQKLVYSLLETIRNNDQKEFFYILLKTINKPKESFNKLWGELQKWYELMPEEVFINFAYSIIIGIMSTYGGGKNE